MTFRKKSTTIIPSRRLMSRGKTQIISEAHPTQPRQNKPDGGRKNIIKGVDNVSVQSKIGAQVRNNTKSEKIMAYQEQCDICLEMDDHNRFIIHQGHTWCQYCLAEYLLIIEDIAWENKYDVVEIREEIKRKMRS
jgi:hypothetical protein